MYIIAQEQILSISKTVTLNLLHFFIIKSIIHLLKSMVSYETR